MIVAVADVGGDPVERAAQAEVVHVPPGVEQGGLQGLGHLLALRVPGSRDQDQGRFLTVPLRAHFLRDEALLPLQVAPQDLLADP